MLILFSQRIMSGPNYIHKVWCLLDLLVYALLGLSALLVLFALGSIVVSVIRTGLAGAGGALFSATLFAGLFTLIAWGAEKAATPEVSDVDVLGGLPATPLQVILAIAAGSQIAGIVGGLTYVPRRLPNAEIVLGELVLEWLTVEPGSPCVGKTIGELV